MSSTGKVSPQVPLPYPPYGVNRNLLSSIRTLFSGKIMGMGNYWKVPVRVTPICFAFCLGAFLCALTIKSFQGGVTSGNSHVLETGPSGALLLNAQLSSVVDEVTKTIEKEAEKTRKLIEERGDILSGAGGSRSKAEAESQAILAEEASSLAGQLSDCGANGRKKYDSGKFSGPCDLCEMSADQISDAFNKPHDCREGKNKKNIYFKGEWISGKQLGETIPTMMKSGSPLCAVFCFEFHTACPDDSCLLPVHMRPGTSDAHVARDILSSGQLSLFKPEDSFEFILDGGGNVGIASMLFASRFPNAFIVSVEPSSANFEILKKNVAIFPKVHPVHAALWSSITVLALTNGVRFAKVLPEYAFQVLPLSGVPKQRKVIDTMQGVSIPFLLDFFHLPRFDFLKVDIEGSEGDVFANREDVNLSFLKDAKFAIMELHDDMWKDAKKIVKEAFGKFNEWKYEGRNGEHDVWRKYDGNSKKGT